MDAPAVGRKIGPFVIGMAIGAFATSMIWALTRAFPEDWTAFLWISHIFQWRVTTIFQSVVGLVACVYGIRGNWKMTAWMGLGYFLFDLPARIINTITYWP